MKRPEFVSAAQVDDSIPGGPPCSTVGTTLITASAPFSKERDQG